MNHPNTYKRLSPEEKKVLVLRYLTGEAITTIAKEAGVSRTIFYRWLKEYQSRQTKPTQRNEVFMPKNPKGRKHWHRIKNAKEDTIVSLWKNNPEYTIRKISELSGVSLGATWKVITQYKKRAQEKGKEPKRYRKKSYKAINATDKIELIKRYQLGESIAKISRDSGTSRTIFYRWLREYERMKDPDKALRKHNPRGDSHWRFMENVRTAALQIVSQNPKLSLSELMRKISEEGMKVSKSGLYYMLKGMDLDTYSKRLAYATSINTVLSLPQHPQAERRRFVAPVLLALILAGSLLFLVNYPFNIGDPFMGAKQPQGPTLNPDELITRIPDSKPNPPPDHTEQDFSWGALSMNTEQDIQLPGKSISIGFGVVDHEGTTVCNAQIELKIFGAKGQSVVDSQEGGPDVVPSGECSLQGVSNTPDYVANIPALSTEGEYSVAIKASTYEGTKDFRRTLLVQKPGIFEVRRVSYPTRIYPKAIYPVEIEIKPQKDFIGTIEESLPKGLTASQISGESIFKKGEKSKIIWKVDFKKDMTYKLSYTLHFPPIWPQFYEIGPMEFRENSGKLVYREARFWEIVADP